MIAIALLLVVIAMTLVRLGWGGRRRIAGIGWMLAAVALVILAVRDGAWGLAMGSVTGMAVALAMVLHAGWTSPPRARRATCDAPAIALPRRRGDLLRRIAVFVLVVPVAFAAAQWLAFAAQALARRSGAGDADAVVLAMMLQPLLWSAIMIWQMTRADARRMIAPPAAAAMLGTLLWAAA